MFLCSVFWLFPVIYIFFDLNYFIRSITVWIYVYIGRLIKKPARFLDESIYRGICLTNDMDFNWHMNNARYLREIDFARFKFLMETQAWSLLSSSGIMFVTSASTIRYRRSLQLFDLFTIRSQIVYWDDKAFYMEHRFEKNSDGFICAIAISKIHMIRATPQEFVEKLMGKGVLSPEIPEEVQKWVQSNQVSSDKLKRI